MVYDDSDTIWFADETLAVFFTIVARGIRQLDQLHGPGSTDRFLEVLEHSLVVEFDLLNADEGHRLLLSELQTMLVGLVETMPASEGLP